MIEFNNNIKQILNAISISCIKNGTRPYLYGNALLYALTQNKSFSRYKYLDFVLLQNVTKFSTQEFYEDLIKNIVINEEIVNDGNKYSFISNSYIVNINILDQIKNDNIFTIDKIFLDIGNNEIIDKSNGLNNLNNNIAKFVLNHEDINIYHIIKMAEIVGKTNFAADNNDLLYLKDKKIYDIQYPIGYSVDDIILPILLSSKPGSALSFIIQTFPDGKSWLIEKLIQLVIENNIAISESFDANNLLSDKKIKLIDIYAEFLLSNKISETQYEENHRSITILKLLFDSPSLSVKTPFIEKLSVFSSATISSATTISSSPGQPQTSIKENVNKISLFEIPPECEYGECPPCDPETCSPKCCCCHSIDIISEVRFKCHKQIVVSCNSDGTSSGPGETPFPSTCPTCFNACATVLGIGDYAGLDCDDLISTGTSEGWWRLPPIYSPCSCDCKSAGNPCNLTCVTCQGLYCESDIAVSGSDCNYNMSLVPGTGCCGTPSRVSFMFVVDFSGSMGDNIQHVRDEIYSLINKVQNMSAQATVGLVQFGNPSGFRLRVPFTTDINEFIVGMSDNVNGGVEPDFEAVNFAATRDGWSDSNANFIFLIGDEISQGSVNVSETVNRCARHNITVMVIDENNSVSRNNLANQTGGDRFNIDTQFSDIVDSINVTTFPTSCSCMDYTPIPIVQNIPSCICDSGDTACLSTLPDYCYDIPIKKCVSGQQCNCNLPVTLNACGSVIVITPTLVNQVCCSDVGFGCDCSAIDPDDDNLPECCGPSCPDSQVCINGERLFSTLAQAQDAVWCACFTKAAYVDDATPNCTDCCCPDPEAGRGDPHYPCELLDSNDPLLNEDPPRCCNCRISNARDCCSCCIHLSDGSGGFTLVKCKPQIDAEVAQIWASCASGGTDGDDDTPPDPTWDPSLFTCLPDQSLVGDPQDCTTVQHPSVVVLNNGIGLVVYESLKDTSIIKIKQFKTSIPYKILSHRSLNFGRLQNSSQWTTFAKLYYYESIPKHFISVPDATFDANNQATWTSTISFLTGPIEKQSHLLKYPGYGTDAIGNYLMFEVPSGLSSPFISSDDAYNVVWYVSSASDSGLVGEATESTTDGKDYIINDKSVVDIALSLPPHVYNGNNVPVAYPSICINPNYSSSTENSQFVNLAYQALEDGKWNVYVRQIRLSEYSKANHISADIINNNLISLDDLGVNDVVYKIICISDNCASNNNLYIISRTVVMEVLLTDGREVFNEGLTGNWPTLCLGYSETTFPKNKVFVHVVQSVSIDRCPSIETISKIFYNWQVGHEFVVPVGNILPNSLFVLMRLDNDTAIDIGQFDTPVTVDDAAIYSSSFGAVWYESFSTSTWSVINSAAYDILASFKGLDVSEPIVVHIDEDGHCTKPIIKVNYNNDIYVVCEIIKHKIHQIVIKGTSIPVGSLPYGVFHAKQIDLTLDYFTDPSQFVYSQDVTEFGDGLNQLPQMFIDHNDVIHLAWQSNRDGRWEIYYAKSDDSFAPVRITNHEGKSLRPSLTGDKDGKLYITWHDDRFENYEIMMAYYTGSRILPLSQQDPYLASYRNRYNHVYDIVPIKINNTYSTPICVSNIVVNFYTDRLLDNFVFSVSQNDWPMAFSIDGNSVGLDDTTQKVFTSFLDWDTTYSTISDPYDPYGFTFTTKIMTSPEFDTNLINSIIDEINVEIENLILTIQTTNTSMYDTNTSGVSYIDNFNRDDGTLGSNWSTISASSVENVLINKNIKTINYNFSSLYLLPTTTVNQSVSISMRSTVSIFNPVDISYFEVYVRSDGINVTTTPPRYAVRVGNYSDGSFSGSKIELYRVDGANTYTLVESTTTPSFLINVSFKEFQILCKDVDDSTYISVFIDNILQYTFIDNSVYRITSGLYGGFGVSNNYIGRFMNIDNFTFADMPSTSLSSSEIISSFEFTSSVEISFRASDDNNDTTSVSQWTDWSPIQNFGEVIKYISLGLNEIRGRYKQSRLRFKYPSGDEYGREPEPHSVSITSLVAHRLCILPGESETVLFDMTPQIRIDSFGLKTEEFPLPIGFSQNQTYFVNFSIKTENNTTISVSDPHISVSCEKCNGLQSTWNIESCSLKINVVNYNDIDQYYNFKVIFYADKEKTQEIVEFVLFYGSNDLNYCTIDDNRVASTDWSVRGVRIPSNDKLDIILWPALSTTSGLLCGIPYYVETLMCMVDSSDQSGCEDTDLTLYSTLKWRCNCRSIRWNDSIENAPTNIRDMTNWHSSNFGFSDTRITDTKKSNNLNPIVKIRSNGNGIIIYETNRNEMFISANSDISTSPNNLYKIYASVFSFVPSPGMYASGAQSISSLFSQIIYRSDIPICKNSETSLGCFDSNGVRQNSTIFGHSPTFDIDQKDSIFLATEIENDQSTCATLDINKRKTILVHTCGADAIDLFGVEPAGSDQTVESCKPTDIVDSTFSTDMPSEFNQITQKMRVTEEFVKYQIIRGGLRTPVVDSCLISLDIIGSPESIAVRLRNGGTTEWSEWYPFAPQVGENQINLSNIIQHKLSYGSGYKTVEMQIATYSGTTLTDKIYIIADYKKLFYNINIYKPLKDTPYPGDTITGDILSTAAIWSSSNKLNSFSDIPVASIRPPKLVDNSIVMRTTDYIFVEIIPDRVYMQQFLEIDDKDTIAPGLDFIQQGSQDVYNIPTKHAINSEGLDVFRKELIISRDNDSAFKDGLAYIIPHFKNDCSDVLVTQQQYDYIDDQFNIVSQNSPSLTTRSIDDPWANERDKTGHIIYKIGIRPHSDDPYLIFGDPNYGLEK